MNSEEILKRYILEARKVVKDLELEPEYKVQAFAIVLSYFLATP
jgi:hypothetical protein